MIPNEMVKQGVEPRKGTALLRGAVIFLLSFFVAFIGAWIYDLFHESSQKQTLESAPAARQTILTVDPNIEKELAQVIAYDVTEPTADLKDPFSDRSNLSDSSADRALPTRNALGQAGGTQSGTAATQASNQGAAKNAEKTEPVKIDIAKETLEGLKSRQAQIRAGRDPGPESAIFFIDDLLPVGTVGGGDGPPEVLMFSVTLKKTFSFPAGAAFRDGWLATWRSDGVVFGDATKGGAIFIKPWSSSVGPKS